MRFWYQPWWYQRWRSAQASALATMRMATKHCYDWWSWWSHHTTKGNFETLAMSVTSLNHDLFWCNHVWGLFLTFTIFLSVSMELRRSGLVWWITLVVSSLSLSLSVIGHVEDIYVLWAKMKYFVVCLYCRKLVVDMHINMDAYVYVTVYMYALRWYVYT